MAKKVEQQENNEKAHIFYRRDYRHVNARPIETIFLLFFEQFISNAKKAHKLGFFDTLSLYRNAYIDSNQWSHELNCICF